MALKPDAQAEFILRHLEEYYERRTRGGQGEPPARTPGAATTREGARQAIEDALQQLDELAWTSVRSGRR